MFWKIKDLEMDIAVLKAEFKRLQDRCFMLEAQHTRLLRHLGLQEVRVNRTDLVSTKDKE